MMVFVGIVFVVIIVVWLSFWVSVSVVGVWLMVGELSMVFRWFILWLEIMIDGGSLLDVDMVKFFVYLWMVYVKGGVCWCCLVLLCW